jgi:hypothetical protein
VFEHKAPELSPSNLSAIQFELEWCQSVPVRGVTVVAQP